jgi:hypothetical protein
LERSVQETRIDHPRDVGIGIAAPLTEDDFYAQLHEGTHYEFARRQPFLLQSSSEAWEFYRDNTVRCLNGMAESVAALGTTVVERCTASDLRNLSESFPIIVLVAHWQTGRIYSDDVMDAAGFSRALLHASEGTLFALYSALSEQADAELSRLAEASSQPSGALLASVNAAMETRAFSGAPSSASQEFRLYANRVALRRALNPGILRGGTGIELHDALLSAHEFARMLPRTRAGVLDSSGCLSKVISDVVRSQRMDWHILTNAEPPMSPMRLSIVGQVIAGLATGSGNYIRLTRDVTQMEQEAVASQNYRQNC